ncbi:hypothetical protein BCR33DRAFT_276928 [Rhizoclosmatium globosum]|uniref:F-box domain-containing protein n=1 Tax=Rhizoclosmatium globosum TaxID=329046 RepID=A0A1Y2AAT7_9FUNG|nr:hypothetical protein BCR33DRAFT_276928 [Rhizoclosmatium globosum]|eukprot:ORY19628.1 hypothetical protein BCR33DRAFT_276928 [Rhizoclosmatium globosum]
MNPLMLPPLQVKADTIQKWQQRKVEIPQLRGLNKSLPYFTQLQTKLLSRMHRNCQAYYTHQGAPNSPQEILQVFISSTNPSDESSSMKPLMTVGRFTNIPDDILLHIFSFLDVPSISKCDQVHSRFASLLRDIRASSAWRALCIRDGLVGTLPG